ncbi:hypothetical protein C8R46DRAFT_1041976 [Mycena filopes]|nr:hypothetical protein C8R46DRAFT_1041976 [Mycena filopes]
MVKATGLALRTCSIILAPGVPFADAMANVTGGASVVDDGPGRITGMWMSFSYKYAARQMVKQGKEENAIDRPKLNSSICEWRDSAGAGAYRIPRPALNSLTQTTLIFTYALLLPFGSWWWKWAARVERWTDEPSSHLSHG